MAAEVTLRDVAAGAGVSLAAASMAVNGRPGVSDPTRQRAASGPPFVLVDNYVVGEELDCVLPDNVTAGFTATRHLIELGHRRIALLEGPSKYKTLTDRLEGYLGALISADIALDPAMM